MKIVPIIYSLTCLLFYPRLAQNDSSYLYFPLNIGDQWQYKVIVDSDIDHEDSIYFKFRIVVQEKLMQMIS